MLDLLKQTFSSLLLYVLICPILGWAIMNGLLELLDGMGIKVRKDRKLKCWIYTTGLVFALAVLIRAFSY